MTGTAEVIQLDAFRGKSAVQRKRRTSIVRAERRQREQGETETGRNFRLRQERHSDWCRADAVREYWKAARAMDSAIHRVQQSELPEGDLHKPLAPGSWRPIPRGDHGPASHSRPDRPGNHMEARGVQAWRSQA
jgi:hypothetical protein